MPRIPLPAICGDKFGETMENDLLTPHGRLTYLRRLANISNEDLATEFGFKVANIAEWEAHGFPVDDGNIIFNNVTEAAASAFRCSLKWLRDGIGEAPKAVQFIKTQTIEIQCRGCDGSGVYPPHDYTEHHVVCRTCGGKAKQVIKYVPFVALNLRTDVTIVGTNHLAGHEGSVSYEEFLAGERP